MINEPISAPLVRRIRWPRLQWLAVVLLVFAATATATAAKAAGDEEQAIKELLEFRKTLQAAKLAERKIDTPNGIDVIEGVPINGLEQFLQIRGHDKDNPVLLYLHGGPGVAVMPFSHILIPDWEEHFTLVNWDQRGTGKTRCANPDYDPREATFDDFLTDTIEVINYLRRRLNKDKIILLGQSWGSFIGPRVAKSHPELLHAYVGTGQVINAWESEAVGYAFALEEARKRGDTEGLAALEAIAPYPDREHFREKIGIQRHYVQKYGGSIKGIDFATLMQSAFLDSPYYSVCDWMGFFKTVILDNPHGQISAQIIDPNSKIGDLNRLGYDYSVPMFFFLGAHDHHSSTVVASRFFEKIVAPHKKLVIFEESGHGATYTQQQDFVDALVKYVKPYARDDNP